jgi:hypothetical protein
MKYIVQVGVVPQSVFSLFTLMPFWSRIECVCRILGRGRSGQGGGILQGTSSWRTVTDRHESPTLLQDKDIGKYNQALAQVLDGISAKAAFIKVRRNYRVYSCLS